MKRFYGPKKTHPSQALKRNEDRWMDFTAGIDEELRHLAAFERLSSTLIERYRARLLRKRGETLEGQGDLAVVRALWPNIE